MGADFLFDPEGAAADLPVKLAGEPGGVSAVVRHVELQAVGFPFFDAGGVEHAFGHRGFSLQSKKGVLTVYLAPERADSAPGIADAETVEALFSPNAPEYNPEQAAEWDEMVWIPNTGQRYHTNKKCSGMKNPSYVTIEEAIRRGFTPCKKCYR